MVKNRAPRSMARVGFQTLLAILPLSEGGGGGPESQAQLPDGSD
jgi:hypothetical protein